MTSIANPKSSGFKPWMHKLDSFGSTLLRLLPFPLPQPPNDQGKAYMERNSETLDCSSTFTQIVFRLADCGSPLCAHQLKCPLSSGNDPFHRPPLHILAALALFHICISSLDISCLYTALHFTLLPTQVPRALPLPNTGRVHRPGRLPPPGSWLGFNRARRGGPGLEGPEAARRAGDHHCGQPGGGSRGEDGRADEELGEPAKVSDSLPSPAWLLGPGGDRRVQHWSPACPPGGRGCRGAGHRHRDVLCMQGGHEEEL